MVSTRYTISSALLLGLLGLPSAGAQDDGLDVTCGHIPLLSISIGNQPSNQISDIIGETPTLLIKTEKPAVELIELFDEHKKKFILRSFKKQNIVRLIMKDSPSKDGRIQKAELFSSYENEFYPFNTSGWKLKEDKQILFLGYEGGSIDDPFIELSYKSKINAPSEYNFELRYVGESLFGTEAKVIEKLTCIDTSYLKGLKK